MLFVPCRCLFCCPSILSALYFLLHYQLAFNVFRCFLLLYVFPLLSNNSIVVAFFDVLWFSLNVIDFLEFAMMFRNLLSIYLSFFIDCFQYLLVSLIFMDALRFLTLICFCLFVDVQCFGNKLHMRLIPPYITMSLKRPFRPPCGKNNTGTPPARHTRFQYKSKENKAKTLNITWKRNGFQGFSNMFNDFK